MEPIEALRRIRSITARRLQYNTRGGYTCFEALGDTHKIAVEAVAHHEKTDTETAIILPLAECFVCESGFQFNPSLHAHICPDCGESVCPNCTCCQSQFSSK